MMDTVPTRRRMEGEEEEDEILQQAMRASVMGGQAAPNDGGTRLSWLQREQEAELLRAAMDQSLTHFEESQHSTKTKQAKGPAATEPRLSSGSNDNAATTTSLSWLQAQQEEEMIQMAMDESIREERSRSSRRGGKGDNTGKETHMSWLQRQQEQEMLEMAMEQSMQCNSSALPASHSRRGRVSSEDDDLPPPMQSMVEMGATPRANTAFDDKNKKNPAPHYSSEEEEVSVHQNNWLYPQAQAKARAKETAGKQDCSWLDRKPSASPTPASSKKPPPQYSNPSENPDDNAKKFLDPADTDLGRPKRSDKIYRASGQSTHSTTRDGTSKSWLRLEQEEEMIQMGLEQSLQSNRASMRGYHEGSRHMRSKSCDDADDYYATAYEPRKRSSDPFRESTQSTTRDGTRKSWLQCQQEEEMLQMGMEQSLHRNHAPQQVYQRRRHTRSKSFDDADDFDMDYEPIKRSSDPFQDSTQSTTRDGTRKSWLQRQQEEEMLQMGMEQSMQHNNHAPQQVYHGRRGRDALEDNRHPPPLGSMLDNTIPHHDPLYDESHYDYDHRREVQDPNYKRYSDGPVVVPAVSNPRGDRMAHSSYDFRSSTRRGSPYGERHLDARDTALTISNPRGDRMAQSSYGDDTTWRTPDHMAQSSYGDRIPDRMAQSSYGDDRRIPDRMAQSSYDYGYYGSGRRAADSYKDSTRRYGDIPFVVPVPGGADQMAYSSYDNTYENGFNDGRRRTSRSLSPQRTNQSSAGRSNPNYNRIRDDDLIPGQWDSDGIRGTDYRSDSRVSRSRSPRRREPREEPALYPKLDALDVTKEIETNNADPVAVVTPTTLEPQRVSNKHQDIPLPSNWDEAIEWQAKLQDLEVNSRPPSPKRDRSGMGTRNASTGSNEGTAGAFGTSYDDQKEWEARMNAKLHDFKVSQNGQDRPGLGCKHSSAGATQAAVGGLGRSSCDLDPKLQDFKAAQARLARPGMVQRHHTTGSGSGAARIQRSHTTDAASVRMSAPGIRGMSEDASKQWELQMNAKLHDLRVGGALQDRTATGTKTRNTGSEESKEWDDRFGARMKDNSSGHAVRGKPDLVSRSGSSGRSLSPGRATSTGRAGARTASREDEGKEWDARMAAKLHDYRQSALPEQTQVPARSATQLHSSSSRPSRSPIRKSRSTLDGQSSSRSPFRKSRSTLDGNSFSPGPGSREQMPSLLDSSKQETSSHSPKPKGRLFKKLFAGNS